MRVVVFHGSYGCDTGCCGHVFELRGDKDEIVRSKFEFAHPWPEDVESFQAWAEAEIAKEFGEEHIKDLDWDNCTVVSGYAC